MTEEGRGVTDCDALLSLLPVIVSRSDRPRHEAGVRLLGNTEESTMGILWVSEEIEEILWS